MALPTAIDAIEVDPLELDLTEPFAIATGTQHQAHNVLVRVRLTDGTSGLGEAAPVPHVSGETPESTEEAVAAMREVLWGADVRAWRGLAAALATRIPQAPAARCAIETAVLDALCRFYGIPLWTWFGGSSSAVETDMTVTAGDRTHAARSAAAVLARGITTIKLKIGARSWQDDVDRLQAVHEAAPGARVFVDANGGYDVGSAQSFLREVAERNLPLALFEQPLRREDPGWRALASTSPVPLCADESARRAADVVALAREGIVRVINIKPMKCGMVEAVAMWHAARAHGLGLMIGGMVESILGMSASAHLAAGLGGFDFVDLDTPMFIASHPFIGGFRQVGARLELDHVSAGHGVGLASDGAREAHADQAFPAV